MISFCGKPNKFGGKSAKKKVSPVLFTGFAFSNSWWDRAWGGAGGAALGGGGTGGQVGREGERLADGRRPLKKEREIFLYLSLTLQIID